MNQPVTATDVPVVPGIDHRNGRTTARFWAPRVQRLEILAAGREPIELTSTPDGWHAGELPAALPGDRYRLLADDRDLPDPCSRAQPEGVHGPSEIVDLAAFPWTDAGWRAPALEDFAIYELHIGTFTPEGTCDAAIARLDDLVDLGITAVELMPVAQCPGDRNWGYDGVYPFAVQHAIGGAAGLQRLVDACHARGLAVVLDVVYNHFGPEGCHLAALAPVLTDRHRTPWGEAVNVDGPGSDGVRALLLANAWQWFADFHVDALRLDAVHEIHDESAVPFLRMLAERTAGWSRRLGRPLHLIAESDLNSSRLIRPWNEGGFGLGSQWLDDFHHSLHTLLTGERTAHLGDFGEVEHLRAAFARAYVHDGSWSSWRQRSHGDDGSDLPTERFVVCAQNHDQIGNRLRGDRLASLIDADGLRCAAAAVLLSPYLPLLFMGEEHGERRPFLFFVDHGDPALLDAVRRGRREEFAAQNGTGEMPDPASPATRDASCPEWSAAHRPEGARLRAFHQACLALRRQRPSLRPGPRDGMAVDAPHPAVVAVERRRGGCRTLLLLNPTSDAADPVPLPPGRWSPLLDSTDRAWGGDGGIRRVPGGVRLPPRSAVLYADAEAS